MRGDPSSPEERESADDTLLHVEPLPDPERGAIGARFLKLPGNAITAQPQLTWTLSAGALVTLLVAFTLLVWRPPVSALLPPIIAPTSTATPSQFGAPEIPQGTGWQPAGPSVAQSIVFAPSDSAISYSCAAPEFSPLDKPVPIILDISRDHGHTWQSGPTPARGVWCNLTVNPTDASDVALLGVLSPPGQATPTASAAPNEFEMYRSFDGGASWSRFMGQYQGQPVYLDQDQVAAGSAPSLFGEVTDPTDSSGERRTYLHSEDGGFSWRPLVAPPSHLIIAQVVQIPDKTLYAELWPFPGSRLESAAYGVYALAPGADKWRFVAAYPHGGGRITVSWDRQAMRWRSGEA